jgi:hypothetical protein
LAQSRLFVRLGEGAAPGGWPEKIGFSPLLCASFRLPGGPELPDSINEHRVFCEIGRI